jgi:hypothetical protein
MMGESDVELAATGADVELFVLAATGADVELAGSDFLAGSAASGSEAIKAVPALNEQHIEHIQQRSINIITSTFVSIYKYT